jgi:hypothetical protein
MKKKVYLSADAADDLREYLDSRGFEIAEFGPIAGLPEGIACHPDLVYCRLTEDMLFCGDSARLSAKYPGDIIYNACSTGKYFIHNLKYTASELIAAAREAELTLIDVPQGYAKCSIAVVSENAVITYDRGIAAALSHYTAGATGLEPTGISQCTERSASAAASNKTVGSCNSTKHHGLEVLLVEPGHINLPGYSTGFIGGCTGLDTVHNELVFNGDLLTHPDGDRIREFAAVHGVAVRDFPGRPLTDIGSIIF